MPTPPLTDEQLREAAETYIASGRNRTEAARLLGQPRGTFNNRLKRAVERGFLLPDADAEVVDGYKIKGTSTLYRTDEDGRVTKAIEWVKTDVDKERQQELAEQAVAALVKDIPAREPVLYSGMPSEELMACYPVGDHHFGCLAWNQDAGGDYDLDEGERLLCGAMDYLVQASPKCKRAAIVVLGDFLHYDSMESITPLHGNHLDADSRPAKMIDVAIRSLEYLIQLALKHHEQVELIVEIGNHDQYSALWMPRVFATAYRNEVRLNVDTSPKPFHYIRHGKCLIGTHHGHKVKIDKLPLLMATDLRKEWGETEYRYWWTGHVHHDQVKEFSGCKVESFRILPPTDEYAYSHGYRSGRDMKAIILHKEWGEVSRFLVNPAMLDEGL